MCDSEVTDGCEAVAESVRAIFRRCEAGGGSTGKRAAKCGSRSSLMRRSRQASLRAALHHES